MVLPTPLMGRYKRPYLEEKPNCLPEKGSLLTMTIPSADSKIALIEVVINTAAQENKYTGIYGLIAYDALGNVLHRATSTVNTTSALTPDNSKIMTITAALRRLKDKLNGKDASYKLRIMQASKNVNGWLSLGWKRNSEIIIALTAQTDDVLTVFPEREWIKASRTAVEERMAMFKEVLQ